MINEGCAKMYCKDDISTIENYAKAIADTTQTWECHHKDEIITLPNGKNVYCSKQDLIDDDRYFGCPANELIFLTPNEHRRLHHAGKSLTAEHRKKLSAAHIGKKMSDEARQKISAANKRRKSSNVW